MRAYRRRTMILTRPGKLTRAVDIELLASAFATLVPALVMTVLFAGVGGVIVAQLNGVAARSLYVCGLVATLVRMVAMLRFRAQLRHALPDDGAVVRLERHFAAIYLGFAVLLGAFAAIVMRSASSDLAILAAVLITGYAAGVSASVALRPWISIPAMTLGVAPAIVVVASTGGVTDATLAVLMAGLLGGGIRSTLVRYRAAVRDIGMRHAFSSLARMDPLTGLPNRLALGEHLGELARSGRLATVYCIDLDDFKLVNDRGGHPAGDAVLREVATRLRTFASGDDLCARIGGDEFVLVQQAAVDRARQDAVIARLVVLLSEPYPIGPERFSIGASIGSSTLQVAEDPETMIARADSNLYAWKRNRRSAELVA